MSIISMNVSILLIAGIAPSASLAKTQTTPDPRAHWITPEEQLKRLPSTIAIAEEVSRVSSLIPALAKIVAEYTWDDEALTNWYAALKRLDTLPKKIPPLPLDIHQIMYSKCPIYGDQKKEDGTPYLVKDTHFLSLVPRAFGSINHLEGEILKPYGEKNYPKGQNPLQFQYFWNVVRAEHGNTPFRETHWVLMTKDVLPGSRNRNWAQQVAQVAALSRKAFVNYEIPTLQESFSAITTDMVATGERRYQAGDGQNGNVHTLTRVNEITNAFHLVVGGSAPSGVYVNYSYGYVNDIGVAALRKF
jgi:hypothetical protein